MKRALLVFIIAFALLEAPASGQKYELDPYAGGFFPGKFADLIEVNSEGLFGIRGGVFVTRNIEGEGNFGYINNLSFKDTLTQKKAYIWEGSLTYNLGSRRKFYGTFGLGGVTTTVSNDTVALFGPGIATSDRFLSLSYGGGIKTLRKWGPAGYRVDVRGRTLPSYYGFRFSWLETTAGLTFAWGER